MDWRRHASGLALGICGGLVLGQAHATEGGASLFIPGGHGPGAGIVPPPGVYFSNDFYTYSGEISGGRRIQIGGAVLADVKIEARADFLSATWVLPLEILGGRVGLGAILPFGVPRVSAGVLIEAPRLGRSFAFSQRDASFVLGDPVVAGLIGWDAGKFHWQVGTTVNIPAGGYQEGELSNLAFNRWIGDVYLAATWLDPETGLDLSGAVGFEINGENPDTDYRSGNAFHVDLSISKNRPRNSPSGCSPGTTIRCRKTAVRATGSGRSRAGSRRSVPRRATISPSPEPRSRPGSRCCARSTSRIGLRAPWPCLRWRSLSADMLFRKRHEPLSRRIRRHGYFPVGTSGKDPMVFLRLPAMMDWRKESTLPPSCSRQSHRPPLAR